MLCFFLLSALVIPRTGSVVLPKGSIPITAEIKIPDGAHDLTIQGNGTTLKAAASFQGRALLSCSGCRNLTITGLALEGNRAQFSPIKGLPPYDRSFAQFYAGNGLLFDNVSGLVVRNITIRDVAGFPILAGNSKSVNILEVQISDSGSYNDKGRNNTTGGILLEEGTADFIVSKCRLTNVAGNGIWTHSLYTSPRNNHGSIVDNSFREIGRDAIQVGHATDIRVGHNSGEKIGYPIARIDVENSGTPVAIDTAGNVDHAVYVNNRFEEINGKCIDLDGFHDGKVQANTCINRGKAEDYPFGHYAIVMNNTNADMQSRNIQVVGNIIEGTKFGGIFVIGSRHLIARNRLTNLNLAHCNENAAKFGCSYFKDEPDLLQSGIYLGKRAERPDVARDNRIEDNVISGFKMDERCVAAAPGVSMKENRIAKNRCTK